LNFWALLGSPIPSCWKILQRRSWLPRFPLTAFFLFSSLNKHTPSGFFLGRVKASYLASYHLLTIFPTDLCWGLKCGPNPNLVFVLRCQQCCVQWSDALLGSVCDVSTAQGDMKVFCYTSQLCLVSQPASWESSLSCWPLSQVFGCGFFFFLAARY